MKTLYFIGVDTQKSAIMKIFPKWVKVLGIEDTRICGIDLSIHSAEEAYRDVVKKILADEDAAGALVTTHKVDLYKAANDMFYSTDEYAALLSEVSCMSKRDGRLFAYAKDPVTSGMGLNAFIPDNYFQRTGAEVLILGAGGSGFAILAHLLSGGRKDILPSRIIVANHSMKRLEESRRVFSAYFDQANIALELVPSPQDADNVLSRIKPYSIIINATGLGKDRPGSPLTDNALFPEDSCVWDFNYRGDLHFLKQAHMQQSRHLTIEDGWTYFVHNWLQCVKEAVNIEIVPDIYNACFELAAECR